LMEKGGRGWNPSIIFERVFFSPLYLDFLASINRYSFQDSSRTTDGVTLFTVARRGTLFLVEWLLNA
jgi:hypothetical protein